MSIDNSLRKFVETFQISNSNLGGMEYSDTKLRADKIDLSINWRNSILLLLYST